MTELFKVNASLRILTAASAAALWGATAFAQTPGVTYDPPSAAPFATTAPTTSTAPIAISPAPMAAPGVGTAAAASAVSGGGELSLRANHGDWEVLCDAANACLMTQIHRNEEGSPDVIFKVSKPRATSPTTGQPLPAFAEIFVPLGVFLPEGLGLRIDQNEPIVAPFYSCVPLGCSVRAPLTDQIIDTLKRGATVTVIVAINPRNTIEIPLSLRGFTAAVGAI
ncbi:invasion associated locus B family protein [Neomegalonema perideroedes]|uniref:invasion associated locus B family protein n=1 Tax=Neomegalonema perideroedes TaxID=217219 RepID=UPI0003715092|nr:invasion associated locus B family protein [Neomegalonema perideroedes]